MFQINNNRGRFYPAKILWRDGVEVMVDWYGGNVYGRLKKPKEPNFVCTPQRCVEAHERGVLGFRKVIFGNFEYLYILTLQVSIERCRIDHMATPTSRGCRGEPWVHKCKTILCIDRCILLSLGNCHQCMRASYNATL